MTETKRVPPVRRPDPARADSTPQPARGQSRSQAPGMRELENDTLPYPFTPSPNFAHSSSYLPNLRIAGRAMRALSSEDQRSMSGVAATSEPI